MKNNLKPSEAIELFSSPKKTFKAIDKTFVKSSQEYIVKALDPDQFALFSSDDTFRPICVTDDVYKTFCGAMYFEYGVGKETLLPSWAGTGRQTEDTWENILGNIDVQSQFKDVNKALNNGASLYYNHQAGESVSTFVITNPYNENFAAKTQVRATSFADGLQEMNSIASLCLNNLVQN